jgi:hypothetical protein
MVWPTSGVRVHLYIIFFLHGIEIVGYKNKLGDISHVAAVIF